MGGHDHCAVYGCNHRRDKADNKCGFYEIPKIAGLKSQWIHASVLYKKHTNIVVSYPGFISK